MEAVQKAIEVASNLDATTAITSGAAVVLITIARTLYHFWKKHKEKKQVEQPKKDDSDIALEVISETYVELVKSLREEVERLKEDVKELAKLKFENEQLRAELLVCQQNHEKSEREIKSMKRKIKRLENK